MKILDKFNEDIFTDAERQVVEYIQDHLDELTSLSIGDLSKNSFTSNATVIRVCHKVKIQGYRQLKMALLKEIESEKLRISDVDYTTPFKDYETSEEIVQNMYSLYQDSITQAHQHLDINILKKVAENFLRKKRVFIFGHGDSEITAIHFINKLVKVDIHPVLATQYHEEGHIAKMMNKSDFALFISYSGNNPGLFECIKILNEKGISSALLCGKENSVMTHYSKYVITIPDHEKENKIATFYSQMSFMYILNNLYALIYHMKKSRN